MFDIGVGSQMVGVLLLLMFLRVPVAFSLGLSALYAMWQLEFGLDIVGDLISAAVAKFSLLAVPFFILAGMLMGVVGIAERMIRFFRVLIGGLPGGMGVVGTVVCLFWGAVSGSGPASVAAVGPLIIKGMEDDGYAKHFAAALVCTGAALSIVVPPSIGLVIYGVIAETSISQLFIAAVVPGMMMGVLMLLTLPFARRGAPMGNASALDAISPAAYAEMGYFRRLYLTFLDAFWGLLTPVVILGGIYSGIFTPTEAANVATVYAIFVGAVIYRTLSLRGFYKVLVDSAASSATVMMIVVYAGIFGWVVTVDDLVGRYSEVLLGLSDNEYLILFTIMLIILIAGMFMDAITIMFIALPIFLPVAREMDWNLVWFGVLLMINLAIGLFTPPVGVNLFVGANITKLPIERIAVGALPFLFTALLGLMAIALMPAIALLFL